MATHAMTGRKRQDVAITRGIDSQTVTVGGQNLKRMHAKKSLADTHKLRALRPPDEV